jgi:hypothetical protein
MLMSRHPQCCPACGRPFPPELTVTGPVRRRLVEIIANHPNGIARGELMDLLYADDADGGPECTNVISVMVHFANRQLWSQGWRIRSSGGPGAKYYLEPMPADSDEQNSARKSPEARSVRFAGAVES